MKKIFIPFLLLSMSGCVINAQSTDVGDTNLVEKGNKDLNYESYKVDLNHCKYLSKSEPTKTGLEANLSGNHMAAIGGITGGVLTGSFPGVALGSGLGYLIGSREKFGETKSYGVANCLKNKGYPVRVVINE